MFFKKLHKEVNTTLTVFTALFGIGFLVIGGLLVFYWRKTRSLRKQISTLEEEVANKKTSKLPTQKNESEISQ